MAGEIRGLVNADDHTEFDDARNLYELYPTGGTLAISGDLTVTGTIIGSISGSVIGSGGDLQTQISANDGDIEVILGLTDDLRTDVDSISGQVLSNDDDITGLQSISGDHRTRIVALETQSSGITGGLTQLDNRYVNVTGDTMTGTLTMATSSNLVVTDLASISGQSLTTDVNGQIIGSGMDTTITVTQATHGFTQLDALYNSAGTWTKAQSDDVNTLGVAVVTEVIDTDNFKYASVGQAVVSSHGLTVGQYYYVSPDTAGQLTISPPTGLTEYSNPIVYALDDDRILVFPWRPNQALNRNKLQVSKITASSYDATVYDEVLLADASSNAITINLPAPTEDYDGLKYDIKKIDSSVNTVSVVSISGNIDDVIGTTGLTISTQNNSKTFVCDGSNYWVI